MNRLERQFAILCAVAGVVLLFVGLGIYLIDGHVTNGVSYSALAGLALLIGYGILDPTAVKDLVGSRQARFGSMSVLITAVAFGILVMANVIVSPGFASVDLTRSGLYTLSPKSVLVVKKLDSDLVITGFYRPAESSSRQSAQTLLGLYQAQSPKVMVRFLDPDTNQEVATRLGVTIPGSLVLQYKDKQPAILTLATQGEQDVTAAILRLESARSPAVCWAGGDGERDLKDQNAVFGYSQAASLIKAANYTTQDLLLSQTTQIPPACDLVAIVGPRKALDPASVTAVRSYLEAGGKLLLVEDPWQDPAQLSSVNDTVKLYGVGFGGALVIDPDPAHSINGDPTTPVVFSYGDSPITHGLGNLDTFYPQTTSITGDGSNGAVGVNVSQSSSQSYEVAAPRSDVNRQQKDRPGPFVMMKTVERANSDGKSMRVVMVGTSSLGENRSLPPNATGGYNVQLLLGSLDWLSQQEDLIALPPKPPSYQPLPLTFSQLAVNIAITCGILPLLVVVVGIAVYVRRRATPSLA